MLSAFMTCMEMYGSGLKIIGMKAIKVRPKMEEPGLIDQMVLLGLFAEAAGTTLQVAAGRRFATSAYPKAALATWVFVWPGLFNS